MIAEFLHILRRSAVCRFRHFCYVVEEGALSHAQLGFIQLAFRDGLYCFLVCSLNPQEVGMRIQSIWTAVEP